MSTIEQPLFEPDEYIASDSDPTRSHEDHELELAIRKKWEKLDQLRDGAGFLATTTDELNEANKLQSLDDNLGNVSRHLEEIYHHQQGARTSKPENAVLSVVSGYVDYATKAQVDRSMLAVLGDELNDSELPLGSSLLELLGGSVQGGVKQFIRYIDLSRFHETKGQLRPNFDIFEKATVNSRRRKDVVVDQYTASELPVDVQQHILETLGSVTVEEAKSTVSLAIEDQKQRFSFWVDKIKRSRGQSLAQPIANQALRKFGIEA